MPFEAFPYGGERVEGQCVDEEEAISLLGAVEEEDVERAKGGGGNERVDEEEADEEWVSPLCS